MQRLVLLAVSIVFAIHFSVIAIQTIQSSFGQVLESLASH